MQVSLDRLDSRSKSRLFLVLLLAVSGMVWATMASVFWVLLIPPAILVVYACVLYTEKALLIFGALTP